jgi:hypothetical protein
MSPFFSVAFRRDNTLEPLALTMRQGKASAGSLKSEWTDRSTYCTPQEARLSIFESLEHALKVNHGGEASG